MKTLNDGEFDQDNNPDTWTTIIPVYEWQDCSHPNTAITIGGFATVEFSGVGVPPEDTELTGQVLCNNVEPGPSGGPDFGTKGSIPIQFNKSINGYRYKIEYMDYWNEDDPHTFSHGGPLLATRRTHIHTSPLQGQKPFL